ncbi:hypothetical protein RCL1_004641 [Eukaryota sp. TZLM3-RCL]
MSDDQRKFIELAKLYKRVKTERDAFFEALSYNPFSSVNSQNVMFIISSYNSYYERFCMEQYDHPSESISSLPSKDLDLVENQIRDLQVQNSLLLNEVEKLNTTLRNSHPVFIQNQILSNLIDICGSNCFIIDPFLIIPKSELTKVPSLVTFNHSHFSLPSAIFPSKFLSTCPSFVNSSQYTNLLKDFNDFKLKAEVSFKSLQQRLSSAEVAQSRSHQQLSIHKTSQTDFEESISPELTTTVVPSQDQSIQIDFEPPSNQISSLSVSEETSSMTCQFESKIKLLNERIESLESTVSLQKIQLLTRHHQPVRPQVEPPPPSSSSSSFSTFSGSDTQLQYLQSIFLSFIEAPSKIRRSLVPVISDLLQLKDEQRLRLNKLL